MLSVLDPAYLFTGAVVDEFARAGVHHVCLCPGSRSTPLAISFAKDSRFRLWTHLDERSAAFFALGIAKCLGMPAIVVCTSGTAAANFMPAVVEARHAGVPLLVLTADRPPELRDCGAAQTIDQIRFYGAQVKWSVEMAVPTPRDDVLRYARVTACRAVARTLEVPAGPVHLNFPFREPLVPTPAPNEQLASLSVPGREGREDGLPFTTYNRPVLVPDPALLNELAAELLAAPRGLIICGPLDEPDLAGPLTDLARRLGYPILADPLSGLRCGSHDTALVIDSYDMLLRDERFVSHESPHVVLRFGALSTAKPLLEYLQRRPEIRQILVARGEPQDPTLLAAQCVRADPTLLCTTLLEVLSAVRNPSVERPSVSTWASTWLSAAEAARTAINDAVAAMDEPFEGRIFTELTAILPSGANLFVGNSMPVRDLDTFFAKRQAPVRFLANRGANGIDGVVSSALGVAGVSDHPTVLVLGDISFYHDMNGLLAANRHRISLVVVVVHNDGGGIFSFLPQAAAGAATDEWSFEELFGTPHGLDFAHAAALYGGAYTRCAAWGEFREAVQGGITRGGLHIVEVRTDRAANVALHRRCGPLVRAAVAGILDSME